MKEAQRCTMQNALSIANYFMDKKEKLWNSLKRLTYISNIRYL